MCIVIIEQQSYNQKNIKSKKINTENKSWRKFDKEDCFNNAIFINDFTFFNNKFHI